MPGIKDAKCVLVIGATAGLGRALALAIHDLDTQPTVIVAGRRQERLDELAKQSDRIKTFRVDINTTEENLRHFVQGVLAQYPEVSMRQISPECCSSLPCGFTAGWYRLHVGRAAYIRLDQARVCRPQS